MSQGRLGTPRQGGDAAPRSDSEACPRTAPVTRQEFGVRFDLYFRRVYAYVSRRVTDKETCEHIVSQVLTASVDLLAGRTDERRELFWTRAFSDRLIELEVTGTASGAKEAEGTRTVDDGPSPKAKADQAVERIEQKPEKVTEKVKNALG